MCFLWVWSTKAAILVKRHKTRDFNENYSCFHLVTFVSSPPPSNHNTLFSVEVNWSSDPWTSRLLHGKAKEVFPWHFCYIPLNKHVWKTTSRESKTFQRYLASFFRSLGVSITSFFIVIFRFLCNSGGNGNSYFAHYLRQFPRITQSRKKKKKKEAEEAVTCLPLNLMMTGHH